MRDPNVDDPKDTKNIEPTRVDHSADFRVDEDGFRVTERPRTDDADDDAADAERKDQRFG